MTDWLAHSPCPLYPGAVGSPSANAHTGAQTQGSRPTPGALVPRGFQGLDKKQHSHTVTVSYRETHPLTVWDTHTPTQEPQEMVIKWDLVNVPTAWCRRPSALPSPHPHGEPAPQKPTPRRFLEVQTLNTFVLSPTQNHPLTNCNRHTNCGQTIPHSLMQKKGDANKRSNVI